LSVANPVMLMTAFITGAAIYFVYSIDVELTIVQLIIGHITIMIMPTLFKLFYALRLVSLKELGITE